jgi:DNA mismatch repair protein MutL
MQRLHSIEILPKSVVEKIAAGEVVERPAAVVKELIENSIDANASRLDITIEDAGFSLIKISDNGTGMPADDLRRCMLHHATSKIRAANDLFSIGTFGFRGEAMGSIAAVSG